MNPAMEIKRHSRTWCCGIQQQPCPCCVITHHLHHYYRRPSFLPSPPANFSPPPPFLLHLEPAPPLFSPIRATPATSSSFSLRSPLRSRSGLRPRCNAEGADAPGLGDRLKGLVGEEVEALLRKEENRTLLDGLEDASRRVEAAYRALADIERQEAEAARAKQYVLELESRRSEIEESQRELMEARTMVEGAERSLSLNMDDATLQDALKTNETEINKEIERSESIKAALVSSIVGTIAGLPISFYQATSSSQLVAHFVVIFISCALFGVTFRYTLRRDLDNIQLKTGTCAAFSFVRGLSAAETSKPWEFDNISFLPLAIDGATYVLEGSFIFLFSAVALDYCFKMGLLSPFPIKK